MLRLHGLRRGLHHSILSRIDEDRLLLMLLLLLPAVRDHIPQLLLRRNRRESDLGQGAVIEPDHLAYRVLKVGHIGQGGGRGGVGDGTVGRGRYHWH